MGLLGFGSGLLRWWLLITWGLLGVGLGRWGLGGCGRWVGGRFGFLLLGMRCWVGWTASLVKCCWRCLLGLGGSSWRVGSQVTSFGRLVLGLRLAGLVMGSSLRMELLVSAGLLVGGVAGFRWMRGCLGVGAGRLGGWFSLSR